MTAAFVLAACAAALVLVGASDDGPKGQTIKVNFDNAFGLTKGGDFRVGGVKAGKTSTFDVTRTRDGSPKAVVKATINQAGFSDFRADASCDIKPQSLIGEYYVDCQPGSSKKKLPKIHGTPTVTVGHTSSTIPQDLVNNILRRPYRERFRLIISELGTGLAGRPKDLAAVLRRAHPGLRETNKTLKILANQNAIIRNFIRDSDTVVGQLAANRRDVARWVTETANTASITATRREQLRQTFHKLPGFLDELRPTMQRLGELSDAQSPLLDDLRRAAPSLNTFLTRLGPFSDASRPAVRSLGKSSKVGTRAFKRGRDEVRTLRSLSRDAPGTFKPLRQFLTSIDDRKRAIDDDPRAKVNGPPASDPSYAGGRGGFTGMEALWNFFFWQGLSINGLDSLGHILRVSANPNKCTLQIVNEKAAGQDGFFNDCNQWLGPNQPGITTPDFTDGAGATSKARAAKRVGERRSAGQPDAGPLPGQRDISKPQVTLPPAVQKLVDKLPDLPAVKVDKLRALQRQQQQNQSAPPDQLLDYLLAP